MAKVRETKWRSSIGLSVVPFLALLLTGCPDNTATPPTLTDLNLSAGLLNPAFDPTVTTYETMFIGDTSVTVTPTASSGAINLPSGNTTITVTGTGGMTTYTITAHQLTQEAYAKASNTGATDKFGFSVALSGNTLVVGADLEDSNTTGINGDQTNNSASGSGAVYVFTRSGTTWAQQAYVKASNTEASDGLGTIALDGDTLAMGAYQEASNATGIDGDQTDNSASQSGAVYVFQ